MSKIRVSAVSYTNSIPFVYGLKRSSILNEIELSLDIPSDCAKKLINNQADIGLVPVAALPKIPSYNIISDFCIGSDGAVNSVFIFSSVPVHQIKLLRMDSESRTSNALSKILLKNYWKNTDIIFTESQEAEAWVQIGDRTFGKSQQFPFVYDLGEEWKNFTGLPFAFAVWASNKAIPEYFINQFNDALKYGLANIRQIIATLPKVDNFDLENYLTKNLDYDLTRDKRRAIDLFLNYLKEL